MSPIQTGESLAGMKPGVSETDRQLAKWMFSQPPFDKKPSGGSMKNHSPVYTPPAEHDQMEQALLGALLSGEEIPSFFDGQMFYHGAMIKTCGYPV
jgi:hypothetical protein